MMQFFRRKTETTGRVGISINSKQLALAHMEDRDGEPYLQHCTRVELQSEKDGPAELERLVHALKLEGLPCSYVLNPRDYSLHLVEAPDVEPEELRAAVRWKIKDMLEMKVDDAAIDVFEVPEDAYRGRRMVYVVASLKSRVQGIIETITEAGLEPAVIDIPELAMRNFASRCYNDAKGVAFMDLRRTGSTLNITRSGELYLTRRINTQLDHDVMQSEQWDTLKDRLVMEIQRSLDYCEGQMGQRRIIRLMIAPRQTDTEEMIATLNRNLAAEVKSLDLRDYLKGSVDLTLKLQQQCLWVLGAMLRDVAAPQAARPLPEEDELEVA